jgi:hydroxymethylpyrimidine/phosphomethylpyrimidine kinase
MGQRVKAILTIGGSDSGGSAGIQADLRTIHCLGEWGTCAITCITAQNPEQITKIEPVSPETVYQQIKLVCEKFEIDAVKIGMLYSAEIVEIVITALRKWKIPYIVLDPIIKATSGARLVQHDAWKLICHKLLPLVTIVTPNVYEAETLAGFSINSIEDMKKSAFHIWKKYGVACVVKGGHLKDGRDEKFSRKLKQKCTPFAVDVLCTDGKIHIFPGARLNFRKGFHGTGCVFSSALAVFLSRRCGEIVEAVRLTKQYMQCFLKEKSIG